jgi:hypothetical protein
VTAPRYRGGNRCHLRRQLRSEFRAAARGWLERHARTIAASILILLAVVLIRNGIAGLTA